MDSYPRRLLSWTAIAISDFVNVAILHSGNGSAMEQVDEVRLDVVCVNSPAPQLCWVPARLGVHQLLLVRGALSGKERL
ncbi:MAG: hypothetical protein ACYDEY_08875 [Acidimicrobiales bacterium]